MAEEIIEVEVAYALARRHWGRGLATEAAQAIKTYGFDTLGLARLVSLIDESPSSTQSHSPSRSSSEENTSTAFSPKRLEKPSRFRPSWTCRFKKSDLYICSFLSNTMYLAIGGRPFSMSRRYRYRSSCLSQQMLLV